MKETCVRRAVLPDIPYLYEICLKTGDAGRDASELFFDPYMLGQFFAAPYLLFPGNICFVAEHEYRAQGYIVAVPDTAAFFRWMEEVWLPPLRERYPTPYPREMCRSENESRLAGVFHGRCFPLDAAARPWLNDYPAHLHINLLPGIQGKGRGRVLIENLNAELIRRNVSGVHLGVNSQNTGGIEFYRKMGFTVLQEEDYGFTMGKSFTVPAANS